MKMSGEEYRKYSKRHMPRSDFLKNALNAFWTGGLICCLGQLLFNIYHLYCGMDAESAAAAESISLVLTGALLTGLGIYDSIARIAGAGTLVPITGFANSITAPAMEFRSEGLITGTAARMFVISGPVIVYGISASVVYGIILCLMNTGG